MYKHILPIPLRERLFIVCDCYMTYSDAYVSVIYDSSFPNNNQETEETIEPLRYYIFENEELVPTSELAQEQVYCFTEEQFKHCPTKRNDIYEILRLYLYEHCEVMADTESQIKALFEFVDKTSMYFMHDYEEEIRDFFSKQSMH